MFEETLYQSSADGKPFVDVLRDQGIMPGIKVDGGLEASAISMQSSPSLCPSPLPDPDGRLHTSRCTCLAIGDPHILHDEWPKK